MLYRLSLALIYAQKLILKVCCWKIIILLCVIVITVVASDHVGERDVLFFQYVLICCLPIIFFAIL